MCVNHDQETQPKGNICDYISLQAYFKKRPDLTSEAIIAVKKFVDETCLLEQNNDSPHAIASLERIKKFPYPSNDIVICYCTKFQLKNKTVHFLEWFKKYLEIIAENKNDLDGVIHYFDSGLAEVIFFGTKGMVFTNVRAIDQ